MTAAHTERETLRVDVNIPEHEAREATPLFHRTRAELIAREGGRCFICGRTAEESGEPLQAHHHPIERSLAEMIDWPRFAADAQAGRWGERAAAFDWSGFDAADPYRFVDDMTANGMLLCRDHHIGRDEGIHAMPHPLWIAQRYARDGYRFNAAEIIHHED